MKRSLRKDGIRRALLGILAAACLISVPQTSYGAGPLGEKVNSGYDAATWEKLQDNVLEYEEIPNLVHEYNTVITDIWEDLEETRKDLIASAEELESQKRKMKDQKDSAKDSGDMASMGNYAMQEAILDAVASGLNSTARSSLLNRSTLSSLQKAEDQFTMIAQSLMISYDSLVKQRENLEILSELYGQQYQIACDMRALGMATDNEVLLAQKNQLSSRSAIESINAGLMQIKPNLCIMAGWPADGSPELAPIPPVDLSRLDEMNLEADTIKAIGNNTTLIEQRNSEKGKTMDGVAARLGVINEGDEKMTIEMKRLYDDAYSKKDAYDAAWMGYQAALRERDGYGRMYQMGMLSRADYLGTEIAYYQKKTAWETADTTLLLAVETYGWAVKGLAELPS